LWNYGIRINDILLISGKKMPLSSEGKNGSIVEYFEQFPSSFSKHNFKTVNTEFALWIITRNVTYEKFEEL